jgi:hypothetical protein
MCIRNGAANEPSGPRGHEADGSRNALDGLLPGVANGEHGAGTVRAPAAQPELFQALSAPPPVRPTESPGAPHNERANVRQ